MQISYYSGLTKIQKLQNIKKKNKKKKTFFCIYICGAQIICRPGPFTSEEARGLSRGRLWSKLSRIAMGFSRGQFGPRQTQSPTRKRSKNGIGLKLGRKI